MLGKYVRDKVTGFKGYCNGMNFKLNGSTQCSVKPQVGKDGKMTEGFWIDSPQLEPTHRDDYPDLPVKSSPPFKFSTGDRVTSRMSGFTGYVYAQLKWINGCNLYWVMSSNLSKDGKELNQTMDESELTLSGRPLKHEANNEKESEFGGPEISSGF